MTCKLLGSVIQEEGGTEVARPKKTGLDYFPLDVDIDQDDKLLLLVPIHGMQGFGLLIRLLMEIYKNGYSYPWTEREQLIFSNRVSVDINTVCTIVNDCINWGFFNKNVYDSHQILTSKGIQERYLIAAGRRVGAKIDHAICLLSATETRVSANRNESDGVNVAETMVSAHINPSFCGNMSAESTQKKRKEIKGNEIKEEAATANPFDYYEQNIGRLSPTIRQAIDQWYMDFPPDVIVEAMRQAVINNKAFWGYANNCLTAWFNKGAKTLDDVKALQAEYERSKGGYKANEHHVKGDVSGDSKFGNLDQFVIR